MDARLRHEFERLTLRSRTETNPESSNKEILYFVWDGFTDAG
jgi:hypothetical protein